MALAVGKAPSDEKVYTQKKVSGWVLAAKNAKGAEEVVVA
jgi:hypothetical protein